MRRTGIDLSSTACFVVDAERQRGRGGESVRVRRSASMPSGGGRQELVPGLAALIRDRGFPDRAWVNLWDLRSVHQYVLLPGASSTELEAAARQRAASALGLSESEVRVATSTGSSRAKPGRRRTEVAFFAASRQEVSERLEPIEAAGFRVEGVTTPCGALWSQALLRQSEAANEVQAYVALGAKQSAIAMFCRGLLLYARDVNWGYTDGAAGEDAAAPDRYELAARLALELRHSFLYLKQYWDEEVSEVLLAGDMPEIRSLTVPLIERLNVEVETLDTLNGYDLTSLPPGFSDQIAAFRLASAVAALPSPANLLRPDAEAARAGTSTKWLLTGAAAAVVALFAFSYGTSKSGRSEAAQSNTAVEQSAQPSDSTAEPEPRIHLDDLAAATIADPEPPAGDQPPEAPTPVQGLASRDSGLVPIPDPQSQIPSTTTPHRVTGILLSDGRRLALIDRSVVGLGDRVGTDTVREIQADAVVLSNEAGEERLLRLGTSP